MPSFHVLQCFSCQTYQVHQEAKSRKWKCKLCGEQQSVIKVFGRGSGKDCRQHVQKLNMLRGERDHQRQHSSLTPSLNQQEHDSCSQTQETVSQNHKQQVSKWEQFLAPTSTELGTDKDDSSDEEEQVGHSDFCKSRMKKKRISDWKKPRPDIHEFVDMEPETRSNTQGQVFTSNHFHQTYRNHDLYPAKMDPGNFTQVCFDGLDYRTATKTNNPKNWPEQATSSSSGIHHSTKSKWNVYLQEEEVHEEKDTKENESSDFGYCMLDKEVAGSRNDGKKLSVLKSLQRKELSPLNSLGEVVNSGIYHHSLRHHSQPARQDTHTSKEIKSAGSVLEWKSHESSKILPDSNSQNPLAIHRSIASSLFTVDDDTLKDNDTDF